MGRRSSRGPRGRNPPRPSRARTPSATQGPPPGQDHGSDRLADGSNRGGDAGFFDPRGGRRSHLGPLRGRHGRGGWRRGRALPGGRGGGAPASLHHGVRRRRGFPLRSSPLPLLFHPSSEGNSFGFRGVFFSSSENGFVKLFWCQREEGKGGPPL